MNQFFLALLNRAWISSVLILAVMFVRVCIKKAPKWITCALWLVVALRLILPFQMESVFGLLPSSDPIPADIEYQAVPQITSGVPIVNQVVNPVLESHFTSDPTASVNPMQVVLFAAGIVWLIGVIVLCLYMVISYVLIRRKVAASQKISAKVFVCDEVSSPFILGIFRPRIYLPSGLEKETMECVLAHEKAHLRRLDHIWKPFGFCILTIYWFHPLCWIAYVLLCKDIELACDEKVTKDKDQAWKATYCQALLNCNTNRRLIAACPVAFGEVSVKDRVRSVLDYRKPAFWMSVLAVVLSIVVAVCFMTNSKKDLSVTEKEQQEQSKDSENTGKNIPWTVKKWAEAFCNGDGNTIVSLASEEVIQQFEIMQVLERQDGEVWFSFGSSPMLTWTEGIVPYEIISWDEENHIADILYYVWTSDPHVAVWREQITLTELTDGYAVSAETLSILDDISTAEEFLMAYPSGIRDTLMCYEQGNSFGEILNEHALSGNEHYQDLLEPETAVYDLLNITNKNDLYTELEGGKDLNFCTVKIHFPDGVIEVSMSRPFGENGIWVPYGYNVANPSEDLESAISAAIMGNYDPDSSDGLLRIESHVMLANGIKNMADSDAIEEETVYLLVLLRKYQMYDQEIMVVSESCIPTVITFSVSESEEYELKEYWTPRDGSYYVKDIQDKFPGVSAVNALNDSEYLSELQSTSYKKALKRFYIRGDLKEQIKNLLAEICSSPEDASEPAKYIEAHQEAYKELLEYGEYSLRYCFSEFLQGDQTDFRGKIMEQLCTDIMGNWGFGHHDVLYNTGQDWFDAFKESTQNLAEQYEEEELEKNYLASWILWKLL